jgi:uncharacterized protein (DUF2252 family)
MPTDPADRVVAGAPHISPFLGERMRAATSGGKPVFVRELLPQDLKLELDQQTSHEASKAAEFLAGVVGYAHAVRWITPNAPSGRACSLHGATTSIAPGWLWSNVLGLLVDQERTYLQHCRSYALR